MAFFVSSVKEQVLNQMIKNVTLKLSSTSCNHCMQAVDNTIRGLPGILSVAVKEDPE